MSKGSAEKPQHHFMIAANIIFREKDGEEPMTANVNVITFTRDGKISLANIGKIQQQVQMQFHRETEGANFVIGKLTITSIMPLGLMTPTEFNASPPGMKLSEETTEAILARASAANPVAEY